MLNKRNIIRIILLLITTLALTLIILSIIPGKQPGRSLLSEMLIRRPVRITVSQLEFDVGRSRVFAHSNGSVASAGTLGIQVLGPDGGETLRDSFRMSTPALVEKNGLFAAFDIGGTDIRIFDALEVISSIETEGLIVSLSLNNSGWMCVVTQEQQSGSRGNIAVYNNDGKQVFRVIMGSGFVLSAKLSDDNKDLAILNIAETGSRISVYTGIDTDKGEAELVYSLGSEIFLDMDFLSDTEILAVGSQSVRLIKPLEDVPVTELYSFNDKKLSSYTYTDSFVAVHLYNYNIGYDGLVAVLGYDGQLFGQIETSFEINALSSLADTLVLLGSEGVVFYNKQLEAYPDSAGTTGAAANTAGHVLALDKDMALVANDLTAIIVRRLDN